MAERTDLFSNTYGHFDERVLASVRAETFGRDIGQNSWLTADEYERFESLQQFFDAVHRLTTERRLSRIVYLAERPAA
ncbi:MAG: hypothetical protein ABW208_14720 [Pyrinomonadaceae bacterium]